MFVCMVRVERLSGCSSNINDFYLPREAYIFKNIPLRNYGMDFRFS